MNQGILIGLGAGLASALLFAAVSGDAAFPLRLLAPLPLAIVALGWGTLAALAGAVLATIAVGLLGTPLLAFAFAVNVAAPPVALGYLLGLSRPLPAPLPGGPTHEWYPLGRVVLAAALLAAAGTAAAVLVGGFDTERIARVLLEHYDSYAQRSAAPSALSREDLEAVARAVAIAVPAATASTWTVVHLAMLWLAARIVRASGRLARPWEDLAAFELPRGAGTLFLAALLVSAVLPGAALVAGPVAGALLVAFAGLGFAVLHTLLRGSGIRVLALVLAYGAVLLFGLPIFVIAALGLAERLFHLRRRRRAALTP